jgi:phosphoribosylaminoimidazolecarboxamide formyltransferase/IMP cyclohydrolase
VEKEHEPTQERIRVRRAFISAHNKTGLVRFAAFLAKKGIELYATEGTAGYLREASIDVRPAHELTGFAELLSGKVKSLSPRLHAGILFSRASSEERTQIEKQGLLPIDMVVVNFYPFQEVTDATSLAEAMKMIDIGGPAALRAAAKNSRWVIPVPEPASYDRVMEEMLEEEASTSGREPSVSGGCPPVPGEGSSSSAGTPSISLQLSLELAARTFEITSHYEGMIGSYLSRKLQRGSRRLERVPQISRPLPERICLQLRKVQELRYGENPHQAASLYAADTDLWGRQLQGKELSFNNLLDLDAAVSACREFGAPSCVIIKHRSPCGASQRRELLDAYRFARDCDPLSAFGGVVAVNRPVTEALATEVSKLFLELLAAPSFEPDAVTVLSKKKNLRLIELAPEALAKGKTPRILLRSGPGGLLFQEEDSQGEEPSDWKLVSKRTATGEEREELFFLWKVARHVVSNAIVIGRGERTLGIGAGQTSRVDGVEVALMKARRAGHDARGAGLASDGFFPFRDSIDLAASAGISAIVEPGGSIRDEECILAADEHGMAMYFTGRRCFKH